MTVIQNDLKLTEEEVWGVILASVIGREATLSVTVHNQRGTIVRGRIYRGILQRITSTYYMTSTAVRTNGQTYTFTVDMVKGFHMSRSRYNDNSRSLIIGIDEIEQ